MRYFISILPIALTAMAVHAADAQAALPVPAECRDLPADAWTVIEDSAWLVFGEGKLANRVSDTQAADGKCIRIDGNHAEWAAQVRPMPAAITAAGAKWRCFVHVKVDGPQGKDVPQAFQAGIWDTKANGNAVCIAPDVPANRSGFFAYEIGTLQLTDAMYVYVTPLKPNRITSASVDRLVLIKVP